MDLQAHDTAIRALRWSHNDQWLVSADHDGFVKYWQPNMNNVHMYQAHKNEAIRCIRCSSSPCSLSNSSPLLTVLCRCHDADSTGLHCPLERWSVAFECSSYYCSLPRVFYELMKTKFLPAQPPKCTLSSITACSSKEKRDTALLLSCAVGSVLVLSSSLSVVLIVFY